ncbi:MAG: aldo/keto reductase, partial [Bdellovibrionales bacterium]|nr:aldo/keto reductase [Bdellovibrionales bacterium]
GGLSEKYELTPEQLMVAWLSTHPAKIVPVLGTTSVERIEMAYHARSIQLETEDWFQLLEASRGFKVA